MRSDFNPFSELPDVTLDLRVKLGPRWGEPSDFFTEYTGDVDLIDGDVPVGRIRAWLFDFSLANFAGVSSFEVLDSYSDSQAEYIDLLGESAMDPETDGIWSLAVSRTLRQPQDAIAKNLLVIDRLEILPNFRGMDYGLQAMFLAIHHLAKKCGLVAIKPFPLQLEDENHLPHDVDQQWRRQLELSSLPANERNGTKRLCRHYGRLGFKSVRGTKLMVLDPTEITLTITR